MRFDAYSPFPRREGGRGVRSASLSLAHDADCLLGQPHAIRRVVDRGDLSAAQRRVDGDLPTSTAEVEQADAGTELSQLQGASQSGAQALPAALDEVAVVGAGEADDD